MDGARSWLVAPAVAFHGECPLDYADTEIGAREVEALFGRIGTRRVFLIMAMFYRIVQAHWAASAMTGEGARMFGGRWNPPGMPAVYLAESRALAALEIIVNAPREAIRSGMADYRGGGAGRCD